MFIKAVLLLATATAALGNPARIVGGTPAMPGEITFQISIQDRDNQHYCGGVIIKPQFALTAASCINGFNFEQGRVIAGTVETSNPGSVHRAKRVRVHPDFSEVNSIPVNDLAIIELEDVFPFNSMTGRAFLPTKGYEVPEGLNCTMSGWGTTSFAGGLSDVLMKVTVPIISKADCAEDYSDITGLPVNQICAGLDEGGADACDRDVGGPLFEKGVVYGIFSWGGRCGEPGRPGVYTEVSAYIDWINANTN